MTKINNPSLDKIRYWFIPGLLAAMVFVQLESPSQAWWPFKKSQDNSTNADAVANDKKTTDDDTTTDDTSSKADKSAQTAPAQPTQPAQGLVPKVQLQSPLTGEVEGLKVEEPVDSHVIPPDKTYVAIDDPKNPLGITTSAQKLNDSAQLIGEKHYKEALGILNPLKDWLVDATEAHINLYKTLKNIPSAQVQAELEKQLALQFALLRDKAFFQLGMLSVGQQNYSEAVKNLSKVIQSQPRSPMGAQAYDVLQKIGFSEKMQLKEEKHT